MTKKYIDDNVLIQDIKFKVISHIVDFMNANGWLPTLKFPLKQ